MRGITVIVFALFSSVVPGHGLTVGSDPDATLMRPEIRVDTSGGRLGVHGAFRVLRPCGTDRRVVVRLTVIRPEDGTVVRAATLATIDYRRDHPRDVACPVDRELSLDVTGLDVRIAAVDEGDGRELASAAFGRPTARAVPRPGDGADPATVHWRLDVAGWWRRYPDHVVPIGPSLASFVRDTCPARGVAKLSVCDWAIDVETGAAVERTWATTDVDEINP
jgi:hypothetical protein